MIGLKLQSADPWPVFTALRMCLHSRLFLSFAFILYVVSLNLTLFVLQITHNFDKFIMRGKNVIDPRKI